MKYTLFFLLISVISTFSFSQEKTSDLFFDLIDGTTPKHIEKHRKHSSNPVIQDLLSNELHIYLDQFHSVKKINSKDSIIILINRIQLSTTKNYAHRIIEIDSIIKLSHDGRVKSYFILKKASIESNEGNYYNALETLRKTSGLKLNTYKKFKIEIERLKLYKKLHKWNLIAKLISKIDQEYAYELEDMNPYSLGDYYNLRGRLLVMKSKYNEAFKEFRKPLVIYKGINDSSRIALFQRNLAIIHANFGSLDSTNYYLNNYFVHRSLKASTREKARSLICALHISSHNESLEKFCLTQWKQSSIESLVKEIKFLLSKGKYVEEHQYYLQEKVRYYKKRNDLNALINAYEEELHYTYNFHAQDTALITLSKYQIKYEKEKNEKLEVKQNALITEQNLLQSKIKTNNLVLIICITCIIFGVVIFLYIIKSRKRKQLQEKKNIEHNHQKELLEISLRSAREEFLQLKEDHKSKCEIIQRLENTYSENEKISELKQMKILTSQDWLKFKNMAFRSFPSFHTIESENQYTESELRLIILLKLNCDKNEISEMIGISPESVRKSIYRLKKKIEPTF